MKILKQFQDNDFFLSLSVFQFPLGSCGGITDTITTEFIYIPCATGNIKYSQIPRKELIFIENKRSDKYYALVPNTQIEGKNGPMSGGNLAYCSDSRCTKVYHIHDRFEKWN